MDAQGTKRRVCTTLEAAQILNVHVRYVRRLAKQGVIWSDTPFSQRAPVYDADQLEARAALADKERAAGVRKGRPPAALSR